MLLCVDVIVKSSAYDIIFMLAGVGRVLCMEMLNSAGWNRPLGDSMGEISCV